MFVLLSTAFAGVWLPEEDISADCDLPDTICYAVVAEVVDANCRGVAEGGMGEVISQYSSTLEIIEDLHGLGETEVVIHTVGYDYSYADGQPNCYDTDPGHPIGEIARYYLAPTSDEGIYTLYMSGGFFLTDDTNGDSEPICDDLPEDEIEDDVETPEDGVTSESESSKTGCQMASAAGLLPMLFSVFVIWGRRRDADRNQSRRQY